MPWRESSPMSERLEFVLMAKTGVVPFAELCRRFGVSRPTGYRWLRRWEDGDRTLEDRSKRPHSSPLRTSSRIEELVLDVRRKHRRWGGRKIATVLRRQGHDPVPAPSTITGILRRGGLLDPDPQPRAFQRFQRAVSNQLWQMDFKGWFELGDGSKCHPFGLLDDHSRYNLCLAACSNQQTTTVQSLLTTTFTTYGLPDEMLCDNGAPWGNGRKQPWTPLGVWLVDLGIKVIHSRPYHPQTAGKQERFHLTLDWEVISTRPVWNNLPTVQTAFDAWRPIYNHQRPHDALNLDVPADHYQPSPRPYPTTIPPVEYPDTHLVRKVSTSGRISLHGQLIRVPKAFQGRYVGIRPTTSDGTYTIHYRHQPINTINLTHP